MKYRDDNPFAVKAVLVVGYLVQLPAVSSYDVFMSFENPLEDMFSLWQSFKMCQLRKVMEKATGAKKVTESLLTSLIL